MTWGSRPCPSCAQTTERLREAAAALEAREVQPVNTAALHALGGIDVIPMPHLPSATIMASPDVYQAFRAAFPSKPKPISTTLSEDAAQ